AKAVLPSNVSEMCVDTTSVRTVEAVAAANDGKLVPFIGRIDLFILPGFQFRVTEGIITNFHLPRTTLLMLTAAFVGREFLLRAYQEAIDQRYRFYSFGDAMLVLYYD
ncbi:MAG: S-adenosylmethionine:tRNA ribosyltransferase-isomerase, partial [Dehalococcoidia bacterium]|nr:S-adenosylmethionine:tRNA ribosyltransferase-isomerase [Dehalococcoidia bacterium]